MAYHPISKTVEWGTPKDLFDTLNKEFQFTLDVCASEANAKCAKFFNKEQNGLIQDWDGQTIFMNPPYGREIAQWVEKASEAKSVVVALLPARTDTQWFHRYVLAKKAEIRWLPGRIYFESPGFKIDRAPFPSMIVIWRNKL